MAHAQATAMAVSFSYEGIHFFDPRRLIKSRCQCGGSAGLFLFGFQLLQKLGRGFPGLLDKGHNFLHRSFLLFGL